MNPLARKSLTELIDYGRGLENPSPLEDELLTRLEASLVQDEQRDLVSNRPSRKRILID